MEIHLKIIILLISCSATQLRFQLLVSLPSSNLLIRFA